MFGLGVLDGRFFRAEDRTAPGVRAEPRPHAPILSDGLELLELSSRSRGDVVGELVDVLLGRVYSHV